MPDKFKADIKKGMLNYYKFDFLKNCISIQILFERMGFLRKSVTTVSKETETSERHYNDIKCFMLRIMHQNVEGNTEQL